MKADDPAPRRRRERLVHLALARALDEVEDFSVPMLKAFTRAAASPGGVMEAPAVDRLRRSEGEAAVSRALRALDIAGYAVRGESGGISLTRAGFLLAARMAAATEDLEGKEACGA